MKAKRTKALEIPPAVKKAVYERDCGSCVWCARRGEPNAHYIPRSHGGLGIEENILSLCWDCHLKFDQSEHREEMKSFFRSYLQSKYEKWDEKNLIYRKE